MSDRTRTGDHLDHNQELYQLSYAHRASAQSSGFQHGRGYAYDMTREDAERECERLAAESPDRATHTWIAFERGGEWEVAKLDVPPVDREGHTETRADEKPATGDDPRPSTWRDLGGPWVGPG